jgi:5-methylcytosine-specific restriction enzyme subunit McrC
LAKLILQSVSLEFRHGSVHASAFLVDMNIVFEDFVVTALREELKLPKTVFQQGLKEGGRLSLDQDAKIGINPDISWWDGSQCTFVGDVKYKRVNVAGIKHPDLYQLLAYTIAADLPGGLLIYAAGEGEPALHRVRHAGKQLEVVGLNLNGSPEQIIAEIKEVANRIKTLRHQASQGGLAA